MRAKGIETRKDMRQSIGYNLGTIIVGTASANGSTTTLVDTLGLAYGGTDDYKGRQVIMVSGTAANIGLIRTVTAFDSATKTLTLAPALTSATASADGYELHETYTIASINNAINQAIIGASDDMLVDYQDTSLVKELNKYLFTIPTNFSALSRVEYQYSVKGDAQISSCDTAWDELVDGDVTAEVDTSVLAKEGAGSLKLTVAAGCAAGDKLATDSLTALDISQKNVVVAWVYSSVALDAGDIQLLLGNTALCASPTETLNIPAVAANTSTRVSIALVTPASDTAIISVGLKMAVDKGAFTLYIDDIRAQDTKSTTYHQLSPDDWGVIRASTPLLRLSDAGYGEVPLNAPMILYGYKIPSELSDDTTNCDIDPDYTVSKATAILLAGKARGQTQDLEDRLRRATWWAGIAEKRLTQGATQLQPSTRWVNR